MLGEVKKKNNNIKSEKKTEILKKKYESEK